MQIRKCSTPAMRATSTGSDHPLDEEKNHALQHVMHGCTRARGTVSLQHN